jgi:anti-anti-sigma regulatory factor
MKLDALKKQAGRLAAYMGAKHRVNLKHASALEALAAVHGARNWQTLAAGVEHTEEPELAAKTPGKWPMALSWNIDGTPHLEMPRVTWLRHAVAFGDTGNGWLFDNVAEAAEAGCAALLFAYAEGLAGTPSEAAGHPVRFVESRGLSAPGLVQMLTQPGVVVVTVVPGERWCQVLRETILSREAQAGALVVGLPEMDEMSSAELQLLLPIAEQGRAKGVVLRSAARSPRWFRHMSQGGAYLANMTHQVYLPSAKEAVRDAVLARFDSAPAVCLSSDGFRF